MNRYYRLNYNILAKEVRLISEEGKQIGITDKNEAIRKAQELGVDLVEISPHAKPPVCKLIEFKKFKYLLAKKERLDKKKVKSGEIKEIRLRPFTDTHDFNVRLRQAEKFLLNNNRVKISVKFIGREIAKKEFGYNMINKFIDSLKDKSKIDTLPHFEGRNLVALISNIK